MVREVGEEDVAVVDRDHRVVDARPLEAQEEHPEDDGGELDHHEAPRAVRWSSMPLQDRHRQTRYREAGPAIVVSEGERRCSVAALDGSRGRARARRAGAGESDAGWWGAVRSVDRCERRIDELPLSHPAGIRIAGAEVPAPDGRGERPLALHTLQSVLADLVTEDVARTAVP